MENGVNDLESMTSRQLSDLRQTLEKARDDKLAELKHIEAELKTTIERLKKVQTAYYETLQREEAWSSREKKRSLEKISIRGRDLVKGKTRDLWKRSQ